MSISFDIQTTSFTEMANFFYDNGYVICENALDTTMLSRLKNDLYSAEDKLVVKSRHKKKGNHQVHKCFFEHSGATRDLIADSKLVDFAQYVIADVPGNRPGSNSLSAHLIHNNAFVVPPGGRGQAPVWHIDDPPQQIILPPNYVLPAEVRLPVLHATYMCWLSDCSTPENGPTYVVPGSHRFGREVNAEEATRLEVPMCGKAGTAVLINPNTWHRGCANSSTTPRETLQLTFARRMIGHKFKTIMNYQMPEWVLVGRDETFCQRMGFLSGGAYS